MLDSSLSHLLPLVTELQGLRSSQLPEKTLMTIIGIWNIEIYTALPIYEIGL